MANMPVAAFLWLLLGYAMASLLGGIVASFISGRNNYIPALMIGVFLTVGSIMNFIMIPHPTWFMVVNVLLCVYLLAMIGYAVVKKKKGKPTSIPGRGRRNYLIVLVAYIYFYTENPLVHFHYFLGKNPVSHALRMSISRINHLLFHRLIA